jgi:putative transposase
VTIYRPISAERARCNFAVCRMCELLGVSTSGHHESAVRAPSDRAPSDAWPIEKLREIWAEHRELHGAPRIHAEPRPADGVRVGRERVERLMRAAGISRPVARKRGRTTLRVPGVRVAGDLVERRFGPAAPNVPWIADATYLRTWEGWLYLAAVRDAFSRRIVGWSMADHTRAEPVVDALEMAVARRRPAPGVIHHPDRGSRYVSLAIGRAAREAGIARSIGSVGDRYDIRGPPVHRGLLQPHPASLHARPPRTHRLRERRSRRRRYKSRRFAARVSQPDQEQPDPQSPTVSGEPGEVQLVAHGDRFVGLVDPVREAVRQHAPQHALVVGVVDRLSDEGLVLQRLADCLGLDEGCRSGPSVVMH